jgi:hypothetical protein
MELTIDQILPSFYDEIPDDQVQSILRQFEEESSNSGNENNSPDIFINSPWNSGNESIPTNTIEINDDDNSTNTNNNKKRKITNSENPQKPSNNSNNEEPELRVKKLKISFKMLFKDGYIKEGDKIILNQDKMLYHAFITKDGKIEYNNSTYKNPTAWEHYISGRTRGYDIMFIQRGESLENLSRIKERYIDDKEQGNIKDGSNTSLRLGQYTRTKRRSDRPRCAEAIAKHLNIPRAPSPLPPPSPPRPESEAKRPKYIYHFSLDDYNKKTRMINNQIAIKSKWLENIKSINGSDPFRDLEIAIKSLEIKSLEIQLEKLKYDLEYWPVNDQIWDRKKTNEQENGLWKLRPEKADKVYKSSITPQLEQVEDKINQCYSILDKCQKDIKNAFDTNRTSEKDLNRLLSESESQSRSQPQYQFQSQSNLSQYVVPIQLHPQQYYQLQLQTPYTASPHYIQLLNNQQPQPQVQQQHNTYNNNNNNINYNNFYY